MWTTDISFRDELQPLFRRRCTGAGIGPGRIDRVIGVTKACTRSEKVLFPTEDKGALGELLRTRGGEFGATTGRPRRCGWNDLVAVDYAVKINGIDGLALTKLDVLSGFDKISVCTAYEIDGKIRKSFPSSVPSWQSQAGLRGTPRVERGHKRLQEIRGSSGGSAGLYQVHRG